MGPAFVVNGPVPAPPSFRLLDVAQIVEEASPHWLNGGAVWPYPEAAAYTFDPCSSGSERIKAEAGVIPLPEFNAFTVYVTETCTNRSVGDFDYWRDRGMATLLAAESYAVEREFAEGLALAGSGTPYLADTNVDILNGGVAVKSQVGMSYLEDAIGQSERRGIIHATNGTVVAWGKEFLAFHEGGELRTPPGTRVAMGAGYWKAHPDSVSPPTGGKAWAWATGDVLIHRTEPEFIPGLVSQAVDRSDNTITYRAERSYLVTWDTYLQAAVLIDWTT
jgi:hypothetical protein